MKLRWRAFFSSVFFLLHLSPVALARGNDSSVVDIPTLESISIKADADHHHDITLNLNSVSAHQHSPIVSVFQFPDRIEISMDGMHTSESLQKDIDEQLLEASTQEASLPEFVIDARANTFYLSTGTKKPTAYYINHDQQQLHIMTLPAAPAQSSAMVSTPKVSLTEALARLMMQQPEPFFIFAPQKDTGLWFGNLSPQQVLKQLLLDYNITQYQRGNVQIYAPQSVLERFTPEFYQQGFTGDQLTLGFSNISIKEILQVIENFSDKIFIMPQADLGNVAVQVYDMPWSQVLAYITTARGLVVKEIGAISIIAAPDAIALANERGCFSSPAFKGFGLTRIELQYAEASSLVPQLENQVQSSYRVSNACEMLVLTPSISGYGKTISVIASTANTQEIKHLVKQLDQPSSVQKE